MSHRIRRYTAVLGTAALVGGSGLGIAQAQDTSTDRSKTDRPARGPSSADLTALADRLGVSTARLQAAMEATRPARPSGGRREGRRGSDMAAALASALGVQTAQVKAILDDNRPTSHPRRGTRPDRTALVPALVSGLNTSEADVRAALATVDAAHRAEHEARDARRAAALARELGLSTETVAAALEATRPARPPRRAA